jgi:hypothetical protein
MNTQETTLPITQNGQYNNITIETKYQWDKAKKVFVFDPATKKKIVKQQGLKPGEHIVVEKNFATSEPRGEFGSISPSVNYLGTKCSFFLSKKYVDAWNNTGGQGDKIKVGCETEMRFNDRAGVEVPVEVLKFEKV